MKLLWPCLLFCLFISCTKIERIKPHAYLDLKVEGSNEEFIWEEIDGEWICANRTIKLYAISDQLSQFSVDLLNVTDTGLITGATIKEINFTDPVYFRPDKVLNGYIRITTKDDTRVTGDFNVEFESVFRIPEKRRIKGSFGIVNP